MTRNMPAIATSPMLSTLTEYPDANVETTTFDGRVYRNGASPESWAAMIDGNGTGGSDTDAYHTQTLYAGTTANNWDYNIRTLYLFDTSAIGGDSIDSGSFNLVCYAVGGNSFTDSAALCEATTASNTGKTNTDYENSLAHVTRFATDIALASLNTNDTTYNVWTLNPAGENHINKTGVTKFCIKFGIDIDDAEPGWVSGASSSLQWRCADTAGTAKDPKLIVNYSAAGPPGVKTVNDLAAASIKTINDTAIGLVKTINDAS